MEASAGFEMKTVKDHLYQFKHNNNDDSNKVTSIPDQYTYSSITDNLDLDRFYFKNSQRFRSEQSELSCLNLTDLTSASMYADSIDQVIFNLMHQKNFDLENIETLIGYENPETYYQFYDDYRASLSNKLFTYNDYAILRGNTALLARLGYKFTLTLNTDNDKVQEAWNPKVAQQIVSVDYSHPKKDFLTTQTTLDHCQSLLIAEIVNAFQDEELIKLPCFQSKWMTSPSPAKLVSIMKKIDSFRKLCNSDKIVLLMSSYCEVISMKIVFKYIQSTDEWINPEYGTRFGRRDLFLWNRDQIIPVIEVLPDRWRNDEVVEALISLITIFNPDLVELTLGYSVRQEQYNYIYLLKRYLESVCDSSCDASDNLYRLLVAVERFRELGAVTYKQITTLETGYHASLRNLIINTINNEDG